MYVNNASSANTLTYPAVPSKIFSSHSPRCTLIFVPLFFCALTLLYSVPLFSYALTLLRPYVISVPH